MSLAELRDGLDKLRISRSIQPQRGYGRSQQNSRDSSQSYGDTSVSNKVRAKNIAGAIGASALVSAQFIVKATLVLLEIISIPATLMTIGFAISLTSGAVALVVAGDGIFRLIVGAICIPIGVLMVGRLIPLNSLLPGGKLPNNTFSRNAPPGWPILLVTFIGMGIVGIGFFLVIDGAEIIFSNALMPVALIVVGIGIISLSRWLGMRYGFKSKTIRLVS